MNSLSDYAVLPRALLRKFSNRRWFLCNLKTSYPVGMAVIVIINMIIYKWQTKYYGIVV